MNTDHGQIYDLSKEAQREAFEADSRAVEVSDEVAADQMRGQLARIEAEIARRKAKPPRDSSLRAHFDRQDSA